MKWYNKVTKSRKLVPANGQDEAAKNRTKGAKESQEK